MSFPIAAISWTGFLGPFHIVMLHFPIGFMAITVLLELWARRRPSDGTRQAVDFTLGLTVVVSWLVSALGYLRASRGEYDPKVVYWHTVFGLAFAILVTVAWILHHRSLSRPDRVVLNRSYQGLMGVSVVLLVLAAHEGGTLTHGARFLTAGAPPIVGQLLAQIEPAAEAPPEASAPGGGLWTDQIEPILAKKCFSCHGAEKQKGKLRLDQRPAALQPGASGEPAIVPGEPLRSRLVASVLLPPDHDDVMPPSGKEPLTPEEIVRLIHWIQAGAPYGTPAP